MTDVRVTPQDVVRAGLCLSGARDWAGLNQIDFRRFMKEGIPVEEMRAVNCALGNRACDAAEQRARGTE